MTKRCRTELLICSRRYKVHWCVLLTRAIITFTTDKHSLKFQFKNCSCTRSAKRIGQNEYFKTQQIFLFCFSAQSTTILNKDYIILQVCVCFSKFHNEKIEKRLSRKMFASSISICHFVWI